jgi:HK97 family phage major capsid protein
LIRKENEAVNRLAEIEARRLEIRGILESNTDVDLDALSTELKSLEDEAKEIRRRADMAASIQGGNAPDTRKKDEGSSEWRNFGEFLQAVRWNQRDSRLSYQEFEKRDMQVLPGASGGFLVPPQYSSMILQVQPQDAIIRPRATVIPAGDPPDAPITFPTLNQSGARGVYSGVTVAWIAEGARKPQTEPAFLETTLTPKEVATHVVVSDKLLRNAEAASSVVTTLLRRAILAAEDAAYLSGNGVGQPMGIIGHPSSINVGRNNPNVIAYADVVAMFARAKFGGPLCWIASPTTLPQLMTIADGNQRLLWQPNARDGAPGTLLGFPVLINERSPVLGTQGDLVLADLQYYLIKDGSGIFISASEHVQFLNNKTVIKAFFNVDGQPWLSTPLLLEDGVSTVSPFVVLN